MIDPHDFVQVYNFCFDDGRVYTPSEHEKAMLEDGINGYIAECEQRQAELDATVAATPAPDPAAQFVMWALMEGSWQGCDIDGGSAQDKAKELGLIVETQYDPAKHGPDSGTEPGESWFVPSEKLLAALGTTPHSRPLQAPE